MNETTTAQGPCVDHLVVFAADLAGGVDWCQRTLGITPTAGGEHPLMGTHNRIFNISSPGHPRAYLEIIAINSAATSALPAGARRWFDMDDATLQQQVAQHGPQLIHWVASVPDVAASHAALAAQDIERGAIITASRPTPNGLLQWQITVREDGLRLMDGCLPTLIQWGAVHPTQHMPASGITLHQLRLRHAGAAGLRAALQALGLAGMSVVDGHEGPASLVASLDTPAHGRLTLLSPP